VKLANDTADAKGQWNVSLLNLADESSNENNDNDNNDNAGSSEAISISSSKLSPNSDQANNNSWNIAMSISSSSKHAFKDRESNHEEISTLRKKENNSENKRKQLNTRTFASQMFYKNERALVDSRLLVDYQAVLDGHCKYLPNLLSASNDYQLSLRLAHDLYHETQVSGKGMVEWSRHLKHENPSWSSAFNEVCARYLLLAVVYLFTYFLLSFFSLFNFINFKTSKIVDRLAAFFDVEVFASRLNFYRDGTDWKPFHHDSHAFGSSGLREDFTMGASFGDSRSLAFLHQPSGSVFALPQENGDVFAFTSTANRYVYVLRAL